LEIEVSAVVDRPIALVWDFYAVHHVENHPRLDPDLELENTTGGPIGIGTVIRRRNTRFGPPTEGAMEVVVFDPQKLMRVETQDVSMTINGYAKFVETSGNEPRITLGGEFPGMDDSMAESIRPLMERSAANIKRLIETET